MNVKILCLAILSREPMSGYEIRKLVAEGTLAHFAEASFGSIYPALERLEAERLVTSHEERTPGKPPRRVFAITKAGLKAYVDAIHQMPGEDEFRSPFLLVAASAPIVDPAHLERVFDDRIAWCHAEIARMRQERGECAEAGEDAAGYMLTLDYGIEMFTTSIRWLEANRARFQALAGTRLGPDGLPLDPAVSTSTDTPAAPVPAVAAIR